MIAPDDIRYNFINTDIRYQLLLPDTDRTNFTAIDRCALSAPAVPARVAVLCGGPSLERGISLNSARSVADHLSSPDISVVPFYMDTAGRFFNIAPGMLYSNTPSDFDFKIEKDYTPLDSAGFIDALRSCDFIWPVIHGAFGEDGHIQELLEDAGLPFIGSSAAACKAMFHKYRAAQRMKSAGFDTLPSLCIKAADADDVTHAAIADFFSAHINDKAVLKPASSGSSIGVTVVHSIADALAALPDVFSHDPDNEAVLEPFCRGTEFSVTVLQNTNGEPVALAPSAIRIVYKDDAFFDFRKKYLPTEETRLPCPANVPVPILARMRAGAERVFSLFGMRDAVRIDGWYLDDGTVIYTDINPVSGMEQNSFLFQQAARAGLSHRDLLQLITARLKPAPFDSRTAEISPKKRVYVIAGGSTAERQVSLMSGTNIWLKLKGSARYAPEMFFLRKNGSVASLPYSYALQHTVEEIEENCIEADDIEAVNRPIAEDIRSRLGLTPYVPTLPETMTMDAFLQRASSDNAFVFIGLHGGFGENGEFQRALDAAGIPYNGSDAKGSAACMDKALTGDVINALNDPKLIACRKIILSPDDIAAAAADHTASAKLYDRIIEACGAEEFILKPRFDGCSAGVVRIDSADTLHAYTHAAAAGIKHIPPHTFPGQHSIIELSGDINADYIAETFIDTDHIGYRDGTLLRETGKGWLELTVGVLECNGQYNALPPSITVAETRILSLEEKFQGGTGINLTPPPSDMIDAEDTADIMRSVERTAQALGIGNYARIDVFYNTDTKVTCIIEANSLPGLTPSTVMYHQALASPMALAPCAFLEQLITSALQSRETV